MTISPTKEKNRKEGFLSCCYKPFFIRARFKIIENHYKWEMMVIDGDNYIGKEIKRESKFNCRNR